MDQGAGETELLFHAAGELAGQPVAERSEVREGEQALAPRRALRARHPEEIGIEVEILVDREVGVEPEALGHVGEPGLHGLRVGDHRDAVEDRVAGARPEDAGEHAQGGRLAGAVGADEPEELAGPHVEVETGDGDARRLPARRREASRETADRDRRCGDAGVGAQGCGRSALHQRLSTSLTSAGRPGLSSSSASPVTRTLTA